jgi:hypothetical protein
MRPRRPGGDRSMEFTTIVKGCRTLLGFPVVIDESIPAGEARMVLTEHPANRGGSTELHMRSFVALEGTELRITLDGRTLTTVEFTERGERHADIASALEAYLLGDMAEN